MIAPPPTNNKYYEDKVNDLEEEIKRLKKNKPAGGSNQPNQNDRENEQKISQKKREWKEQLNHLTIEKLNDKIRELENKLNQVKNNPNSENADQKGDLEEQLNDLKDAKSLKENSLNNQNNNGKLAPTLIIGGSALFLVLIVVSLVMRARNRRWKKFKSKH